MKREEAQALVASVVALREGATDQVASTAVAAYPVLHGDGRTIEAGTRIHHGGRLLRAAVTLFDTPENVPEKAPTLWEEINYREGYRIIPQTITPGLAFQKGEKGWWKGELYESILPTANTYTPAQYPQGWKKAAPLKGDGNLG